MSLLAEPGKGAFTRFLARVPVLDMPEMGQAVLGSAFILLVASALAFAVTPSDSLVWQIVDVAVPGALALLTLKYLVDFIYLKWVPESARLRVTTHKCRRCGYGWTDSNTPGDTQIRRMEWDLAECRKRGDEKCISSMLSSIGGMMTMYRSDPHGALPLLEEAIAMRREAADKQIGNTLNNLAFTLLYLGQGDRARAYALEAVTALREQKEWNGLASALNSLGFILLDQGETGRAGRIFTESLQLKRKLANLEYIAWDLEGLAAVAAEEGLADRATRLLAKAGALRQQTGKLLPQIAGPRHERALALARGGLGEATMNYAWSEGWNMPLDYAIAHALGEPAYPMAARMVGYSVLS
jgi:tetratricopeptide (TPR) repeat protein